MFQILWIWTGILLFPVRTPLITIIIHNAVADFKLGDNDHCDSPFPTNSDCRQGTAGKNKTIRLSSHACSAVPNVSIPTHQLMLNILDNPEEMLEE